MSKQSINKENDINKIKNVLKKHITKPLLTIPIIKDNNCILIAMVNESLIIIKEIKEIREEIYDYNKNIDLEWSMENNSFITINFKYINV